MRRNGSAVPNGKRQGFTLAELLIALMILGVIATFTIPKVLQSQQDSKFNAIGKEAVAMFSEAYQVHKAKGLLSASTTDTDLTQYMNYVAVDTSSIIDHWQGSTTTDCSVYFCLRLHNGAMLESGSGVAFGGTDSTSAIYFRLDPDGKVTDGTTNGPGKAIQFFVYYNGKVRTWGTIDPHTANSWFPDLSPDPTRDPPWFSWN